MKKNLMTAADAEQLIWSACEEQRGHLASQDLLSAVLDVLIWARWIPTSTDEGIGYFDTMSSLANDEHWNGIQTAIGNVSGNPLPSSASTNFVGVESIEKLRATLLPLARSINTGDPMQCKVVIEALLSIQSAISGRVGGEMGCSPSMGRLCEALLASDSNEPVACLFAIGVGSAPLLGWKHPLLISSPNSGQEPWVLKLLSLYPGDDKPGSISDAQTWPLAFAAPPWGERSRELLVDDPWLPPAPLDCPAAIKDSEARRIYAAHQRCSGTTYALVSPGIGFRTSRDVEYFREELVRKNWLDAVVALPAGAISSTRVEGLLFVLKKDRLPGAKIQMVEAQELLGASKGKGGRMDWDPVSTTELAHLLQERSEKQGSRLIPKEEIEANGFNLQPSRYLHSQEDLTLQRYIASRDSLQLGDLAEIRRPVAALGRQEEDGIEVREVTPGDIDESGRLRKGSKVIRLPESALAKGRQHLLEPGDVLLSIKGGLGRVAVVQDLEQPTVPGQAFCVIRLRPNAPLTPVALVQYLRSALGQSLLGKAGQGTSVAFMPMGEVKSLPIVIPQASELRRAEALEEESVYLNHQVEELSRRLAELSRHGWMEDLPTGLVSSAMEGSL